MTVGNVTEHRPSIVNSALNDGTQRLDAEDQVTKAEDRRTSLPMTPADNVIVDLISMDMDGDHDKSHNDVSNVTNLTQYRELNMMRLPNSEYQASELAGVTSPIPNGNTAASKKEESTEPSAYGLKSFNQ